ncbi:MAG: ABC transporter substrate-binding protein [Phycisphaerales bacterium]|nr:MAG: ABC transporter substrate-binding protein [Phycisphaerales bacterium]
MSDSRPLLQLAHSPDPDDAFMWWPLLERDGRPARVDTGRFRFETVHDDIESLNQRSREGELEITAMSCANYPQVSSLYAITACGASMGDHYGPKLVARPDFSLEQLRRDGGRVAIPGTQTSAYAAARLMLGADRFEAVVVPFEQIIDRVGDGAFDAGIVIHEGQLTYRDAGLELLADLGAWWSEQEGVPLPLGINAIRRDLEAQYGPGTLEEVTETLLASVEYALSHRAESVEYALQFARGMSSELADEFVTLYVNKWTLDFGTDGRAAVEKFLLAGSVAGILPHCERLDFIAPANGRSASVSTPNGSGA